MSRPIDWGNDTVLYKLFSFSSLPLRSGLQISLFVGIVGLYSWPWLADKYGRRTLLAVNIALFSLLMMRIVIVCRVGIQA